MSNNNFEAAEKALDECLAAVIEARKAAAEAARQARVAAEQSEQAADIHRRFVLKSLLFAPDALE